MKLQRYLTIAALSTITMTGFAHADGTPSGKLQLFADMKGNYYGCAPGSQDKGPNTSLCSALVAAAVNQIKAGGVRVPLFPGLSAPAAQGTTPGATSGGTTTGGSPPTGSDDVDTESTKVTVSTDHGLLTCPVTAFSADKALDPSACSRANTSAEDARVVCLPPASGAPLGGLVTAGGTIPSMGTTATPSSTGATTLVCSMPGETYSKNPLPKTNGACPGGGTRTVVGGYDAKVGTVDVVVTLTNCIDHQGNTHNGTASMQGTLTLTTSTTVANPSTTFDMNETKAINTTVTFKSGGKVARNCTVKREGSYDDRTGTFSGTVTRNNCTLTGDYKFRPGLVDNLIENANEVEPI